MDPSQPLPSESPWPRLSPLSTGKPLTLLIAGQAAGTAGLVVVLPGQEGPPGARKAGDVATRLCARARQVVSCGTQTGQMASEGLRLPLPPAPSLAPHFSPSIRSPHPWLACHLSSPPPGVSSLLPTHPLGHSPAGQPLQQKRPLLFWELWAQSHLRPGVPPWAPSTTRRAWGTGAAGYTCGCPGPGLGLRSLNFGSPSICPQSSS